MDFVHTLRRTGQPASLVQPALAGSDDFTLFPQVSPSAAGKPGVMHGLIRRGGSGLDKNSGFLIRISKLINWKTD